MSELSLMLPDFALIALGYLLCRHTPLDRSVWDGAERLVYYLLFPALLFHSIARNSLQPGAMAAFCATGVALVAVGIAAAYAVRLGPGVDGRLHASGAQAAFRFNSYIALAVAERLAGVQGVAWQALLVSLCVPLCNVAAVWPLARQGGHGYLRELVRNPLILATVSGLAVNLAGIALPEPASIVLSRVGAAALPLGLMAVGAGLRFGALRDGPGLAAAFLSIRHALLPALAIALVIAQGMPAAQQAVMVAFAAMPTASSAYVLATRMGGHGSYVAGLVTLSTLLAMPGLPLALAALAWLR
ncbi:MAG: AEC family transporter [Burkholderiaceae bacterium]|nr:AEC family transporter [Aquabacterium sp.]NUP85410.1 AEC family transporter [Burkholderiaceae bacterium]